MRIIFEIAVSDALKRDFVSEICSIFMKNEINFWSFVFIQSQFFRFSDTGQIHQASSVPGPNPFFWILRFRPELTFPFPL